MSFSWVIYKSVGEQLLIEAWRTQWQLHYPVSVMVNETTKLWITAQLADSLRDVGSVFQATHYLLQAAFLVFYGVLQLDWCLMMVGLSIFCATHLVWQCPQCLPIIYAWGRRAPVNLSNFCDFPKLWSFLFLNLSSFSAGMIVSPSLRKVSLNLYVTISLGFHIRYPAYEIFTLQFIIIS